MKIMKTKAAVDHHGLLTIPVIPADSDLEIICDDGAVVILASDILKRLPEELAGLFQELGIHPDTIREVMRKEGYYL